MRMAEARPPAKVRATKPQERKTKERKTKAAAKRTEAAVSLPASPAQASLPVSRKTRPDSSATRILGLLDLFTAETPTWTVDMLQEHLGLARATVYRYARELHNAGFLVPAAGGGYVLGPRFIEFDRQIRLADPLLRVGEQIMKELSADVAGTQLLCAFYGDRVLTVHEERTDETLTTSFQRGLPFALFKGAPSRIILAHLPSYQLKNIFLAHSETIASVGLGNNWAEFRDRMKDIRKTGYYVGSEIDKRLVGVAAPIFRSPGMVTGCLCLVRLKERTTARDIAFLAKLAMQGAEWISAGMQTLPSPKVDQSIPAYPAARVSR